MRCHTGYAPFIFNVKVAVNIGTMPFGFNGKSAHQQPHLNALSAFEYFDMEHIVLDAAHRGTRFFNA